MHRVDLPVEMFSDDLFLLLRIGSGQHSHKIVRGCGTSRLSTRLCSGWTCGHSLGYWGWLVADTLVELHLHD